MFTVKVFNRDEEGREYVSIHHTKDVEIHRNDSDWLTEGERGVTWVQESGDVSSAIVSNRGHVRMVIIENMHGQTTEIVRPSGRASA